MPSSVALTAKFDAGAFAEPESVLWPGAFWLWNAPLNGDTLRAQLRDMAAHGLRSVCMLPMPHAFRPDNTNNLLEPDYLTPDFFNYVRLAVDEAARLDMNWWLYDEGGWPSGQAVGKVTEGHPEFGQQRLIRDRVEAAGPFKAPDDAVALVVEGPTRAVVPPGQTWTPAAGETAYVYRAKSGGYVDLLNPQATDRFIELTHEAYKKAIGNHFGKTVRFTFTDEPSAPNLDPPRTITWTPGLEAAYAQRFGKDIFDVLPALFTPPGPDASPDVARARIDFYDLWTGRFRDAYFKRLENWDRREALASGGHLNGEDETINVVRYGFGEALRQLRAMDVPGVDLIWRQLFPGRPNQHFFPKYASSAAHQNGTRFAFTESFCVYGNGLTPAQMKWLVDYQYVRGINLLVVGCFPLTTQDHHMTGERPHFGAVDPLWDHLPGFFGYTARLGYALSVGKPKISTALYYPARDMWALGLGATDAVETHDQLAQGLLAHQCDFDLIDDDMLIDSSTHVENGELVAGAMRYNTVVCGAARWMHPEALAQLKRLAGSGGCVYSVSHVPGADGAPGANDAAFCKVMSAEDAAASASPTARISPPCRDIRVASRSVDDGELVVLFNEGEAAYAGALRGLPADAYRLDPETGRIFAREGETPVDPKSEQGRELKLQLAPGESLVLLVTARAVKAEAQRATSTDVLPLDATLTAAPRRRFIVGEHDFEIVTPGGDASWWGRYKGTPLSFAEAGAWKTWLTEDFSGEVDYRVEVDVPEKWADAPIVLETGPVEYAATVLWDGAPVGRLLWAVGDAWRVEIPAGKPGRHELIIRVANTLANELTSERVKNLWAEKTGPGWPSPYHKRALVFEKESRGGRLQGPIRLVRMERTGKESAR